MEKTIRRHLKFGCVVSAAIAFSHLQVSQAGWSGAINGTGYGQATVNVTASTEKVRILNTTNMLNPSAAIKTTPGYIFGASLPSGSSLATVARVLGQPGYIWQADTVGSGGDSTDNPELESRVHITPADCAAVNLNSESHIAPGGKSGTITVNANGTAGTAIWLRGFEFTGGQTNLPVDDPSTPLNEFVEYLKAHGSLKWDVLMVGPFDFNTTNCTGLTIPFTIDTDTNNLYFVSDAVAKSLPLVVYCPPDVTVACNQQPVAYPNVQVAGCGDITISNFPPAGTIFPVGTNQVWVTAIDKDGNTTNCTFNVIVNGTAPVPNVASLPDATGQCAATIAAAPTATEICSGAIITGQTTNSLTRTTQGTSIVTWTFDDGHGNVSTQTQKIIVKDTMAPVVSLQPFVVSCANTGPVTVPVPTTGFSDNCGGSVTVTPSQPQVFSGTGPGVLWTFTDAANNSTTVTQLVSVSGLTFVGFYTPINTASNNCSAAPIINAGRTIPIKFDFKCGSTFISGGTPPIVTIEKFADCSSTGVKVLELPAEYQNDWHINWNITPSTKGLFKIIVTHPGGTTAYAFINLK